MTFAPGTLRSLVEARTAAARASGHLESIPTEWEILERDGFRWVIRTAATLAEKKQKSTDPERNPFLPYEEEMYVADASPTHVCLLNKYNVVDHHLAVVTRHFEDQRTLLTPEDFDAIHRCLDEIDGLAFYNGGPAAGASQRHKHLQLVPRVDPELDRIVEPPPFPFLHVRTEQTDHATHLASLGALSHDPKIAPAVGVEAAEPPVEGSRQPFPYNLLMTRRWMIVVPRVAGSAHGISINALGFAGAFLVRTDEERELIRADPIALLAEVTPPV